MMTRTPSQKRMLLKYLSVLPFILVVSLVFTNQQVQAEISKVEEIDLSSLLENPIDKEIDLYTKRMNAIKDKLQDPSGDFNSKFTASCEDLVSAIDEVDPENRKELPLIKSDLGFEPTFSIGFFDDKKEFIAFIYKNEKSGGIVHLNMENAICGESDNKDEVSSLPIPLPDQNSKKYDLEGIHDINWNPISKKPLFIAKTNRPFQLNIYDNSRQVKYSNKSYTNNWIGLDENDMVLRDGQYYYEAIIGDSHIIRGDLNVVNLLPYDVHIFADTKPELIHESCAGLTDANRKECSKPKIAALSEKYHAYPSDALKDKAEGFVVINFTVEVDGGITNIRPTKNFGRTYHPALEADAIHRMKAHIKEGFQYIPAQVNGKAVRYNNSMVFPYELPKSNNSSDFKIQFSKSNNKIYLNCIKGCGWKQLTLDQSLTKNKLISYYGIVSPIRDLSKGKDRIENATLTENEKSHHKYFFQVSYDNNQLSLDGIHGVAWNQLGGSLSNDSKAFIDNSDIRVTATKTNTSIDSIPVSSEVFSEVEEMPQFPGGNDALVKYIHSNLQYPKEAKDNNIQGEVLVEFVLAKDGQMKYFKATRNPGHGTPQEALRVLSKMASEIKWIPGKQRGIKVDVKMVLPITFALSDDYVAPEEEIIKRTVRGKAVKDDEGIWRQIDTVFTYYPERFEEEISIISTELPLNYSNDRSVDNSEIFKVAEQNPEYPGGNSELFKYIFSHLKYPTDARKNGIQGNAVIGFVVEKDGTMSNLTLRKDPGAGLGDEALRVVNILADEKVWIPGKQAGKNVRVQYNLPIRFKLETSKEDEQASDKKPLIVLYDKKGTELYRLTTANAEEIVVNIDPKDIDRIDVLKGDKATALFGIQGKDGVLQVYLKKASRKAIIKKKRISNEMSEPIETAKSKTKSTSTTENKMNFKSLSLLPNPVTDELIVDLVGVSQTTRVMISTIDGKELYQDLILKTNDSNERDIKSNHDISNLPSGVLIVSIIQGDKIYSQPIVKK